MEPTSVIVASSFDPYTQRVWEDTILRELIAREEWKAAIDHCNEVGTNFNDFARMWALAMTACYGPTGLLHASRLTNGRPDPTKCTDCPRVFERIAEAQAELRRTMGIK